MRSRKAGWSARHTPWVVRVTGLRPAPLPASCVSCADCLPRTAEGKKTVSSGRTVRRSKWMSPHKALRIAPRAALPCGKCSSLFQEHNGAGSQARGSISPLRDHPYLMFSLRRHVLLESVWGCTLPLEHWLNSRQTRGIVGSCAQTQGPMCRSSVKVRNPRVLAMWAGRTWATDETDPLVCSILVAAVSERWSSLTSELGTLQDCSTFSFQKAEAQRREDHSYQPDFYSF